MSDDCLRIMAETHNSDYNACSSNNAVTSRSVVYVNVPARAPRRRVRRLFRVPLSPTPVLRRFSHLSPASPAPPLRVSSFRYSQPDHPLTLEWGSIGTRFEDCTRWIQLAAVPGQRSMKKSSSSLTQKAGGVYDAEGRRRVKALKS